MKRVLPRFLAFYVLLFIAFGIGSPFLGPFLAARGLSGGEIGLILAGGTAIRILTGPLGGRLADRIQASRGVLTGCTAASAALAYCFLPAYGWLTLLAVNIAQCSTLAPVNPLADALAVREASSGRFAYGWVRGAASAAFIMGTLLAGPVIARFGLISVKAMSGTFLLMATAASLLLPSDTRHPAHADPRPSGLRALLRMKMFRRAMLAAGLIQGSHALHDGFAILVWQQNGIGSVTASWLWSESVAAEVAVFLLFGRRLIEVLRPSGACALCALGGCVRWIVLATSHSVAGPALVEPLHGLTFALQHLVSMRVIAEIVPPGLTATAQTIYNTVAVGAIYALLSLLSGGLFDWFGQIAFLVMAMLCALALPVALTLRLPQE